MNQDQHVLVVAQTGDSWSLPKGHIDQGEEALIAAKREIFEEAGVSDLTLIQEFPSYERYKISLDGGDEKSELKTIQMFLFTTSQMELESHDPQNPEARWVKIDEVENLLTHTKDKEFFRSIHPIISAMK